jgi:UDP-N-acetylglucosamine--N-acetylmuramyl-(pentapeptide) pyrophosphoryl-undecaprenol N-acetylglucosamine transferase
MRVSLAAAGTAGHIEPALALARWLKSEDQTLHCEFIGTSAALDSSLMQASGFALYPITKAPFPRGMSPKAILWPFRFAKSLREISRALRGSDLVVGFGGYVCAPTYIVARIKRIPIIIHEANTKPGMANNLGRRLGAQLAIAFESTKRIDPRWSQAIHVGMPVRESVRKLAVATSSERESIRNQKASEWGFDPKQPIVVVFGGSQGSRAINRVIAEILPQTAVAGIQIVHALGSANDLPARSKSYLPLHYISDMPETLVACDFAITRGGAVTCAELGILQTFAVVVPLAIGNGEQSTNANELTERGAALVVNEGDFTARYLSEHFISFVKAAAAFKARSTGPAFSQDADAKIGALVLKALRAGSGR